MENGGFSTTESSYARTKVEKIDSVEVVHVKDGQIQLPDYDEVMQYDTEGNKKKKSCKET